VYFRQIKRDIEAQGEAQSSLLLATQAKRVQPAAPVTALDHAAVALEALLTRLKSAGPDERAAQAAAQALESFRAFGSDRWLSATAQLVVALGAVGVVAHPEPHEEPLEPVEPAVSKRTRTRKKRTKSKPGRTPKVPAPKPKRPRKKIGKARPRGSAKRRA
jgi:hypothetical protein